MEKLRVIQVGAGRWVHADHAAKAVADMNDLYELLGFVIEAEDERARAEKLEEYQGRPWMTWDEAVALKPDAFIVETDEHQLVPSAIRALEAGFPVYMDKPGSEDCAMFHRMCDLAEEKKLPLCLGYMYRYNPGILHAEKRLKDGDLGEMLSVEGQMSVCGGKEYRQYLGRFQGGMLYYLGCHLIDAVIRFCGFPEKIVPMNTRSRLDGIDSVDTGCCALIYKNGVSLVRTSAVEVNGIARRQIIISGSKGTVELNPTELSLGDKKNTNKVIARETLNTDRPWSNAATPLEFEPFRRYDALFRHFAAFVRGTEVNPFTPAYEARVHDCIMQACAATADAL